MGLLLAVFACVGSYQLGLRYEWREWFFIAPFLLAAGFALVFGVAMHPLQGFTASAVYAAALIVPFWLGLDSGHWLHDPVIRQGFATWVGFSVLAIPMAWLIGVVIGYIRRSAREK